MSADFFGGVEFARAAAAAAVDGDGATSSMPRKRRRDESGDRSHTHTHAHTHTSTHDGGKRSGSKPRSGGAPAGSLDSTSIDAPLVKASAAGGGGGGKSRSGGFQSLGLSTHVFSGVMRMGFKVPTPVQRKTLPIALSGRDVVAMARTGSGKTAAFVIPMLERLRSHNARSGVRAVILSPTRELALQTFKVAKSMGKFTGLRMAALVGGESMGEQFSALAEHPDVIIATPGRLMHLLMEVPGFGLKSCEYVVFDEADRLFEMGFAEQLREILSRMPAHRQTLLFSATLPAALVQFARAGLKEPELIRLDVDTKVSENLRMAFFTVRKEEKAAALVWVCRTVIPEDQQALVFAATRHHTEFLSLLLRECGVSAEPVYGDMDMTARVTNLARFRSRKLRVLVCTDVAARGLDLPLLDNVINYDFPDKAKLFVHRCGRVARQGRTGTAFSLVASTDLPYMMDILLFLGRPVANGVHVVQAADPTLAEALDDTDSATEDEDGALPDDAFAGKGESGARAAAHDDAAADSDSVDDAKSVASSVFDRALPAASSAPAAEYTLETMTPGDVHYGQIPRSAMELDIERVRHLVATRTDCAAFAKSSENAMQLYNRSRAPASRGSVGKSRMLPHDAIHPLLRQYAVENEDALRNFITGLQSFRPTQTVFELETSRRDKAAMIMSAKRAAHGKSVGARVGSVSLDAAASAAARGAIDTSEFGAALKAGLDAARATGRATTAANVMNALAAGADVSQAVSEADMADEDADAGEREADAEPATVGADVLADLLYGSTAGVPTGRRRISAKERQLLKRGVVHAADVASLTSEARVGKAQRRAALRSKGSELEVAFRDEAHYVGFAPAHDLTTEAGFSAKGTLASAEGAGVIRGDTLASELAEAAKLADSTLDIMPDEKDSMATRNRRVRYWDKQKKQYLMVPADEIVNGKRSRKLATRNESGAKVNQDGKHKYGEIYRKWVKATRRQIAEGGDDDDGDGPPGASGARGGKTARVVEFGDDDDEHEDAGGGSKGRKRPRMDGKGKGAAGANEGGRGKHVREELRSVGQIKKERLRKAKSQGKLRKFMGKKPGAGGGARMKGAAPARSKVVRRGSGGGRGRPGGGGRGGGGKRR